MVFDEKTKGTNKEVITKILQSAYDRKLVTRGEVEQSVDTLQDINSTLYKDIKINFRDEDLTEEESKAREEE